MKFEEAAIQKHRLGWECAVCGAFYPGDNAGNERAARWCHATDLPCERCGGRNTNKHRTMCAACLVAHDAERWAAMPEAEWDGNAALAIWDDDKYFFCANDVRDYCEEEDIELDQLRLVICAKVKPRKFSFVDFFYDDLSEAGQDGDYSGLDEYINFFLAGRFPESWEPTQTRASLASLQAAIGPMEEAA